MYFALIDESGKATDVGPFVLSALIMEDSLFFDIENIIMKMKLDAFPKVDPWLEIHANYIVHGKSDYRRYDVNVRKSFMNKLYGYISTMDCTIISVISRNKLSPQNHSKKYVNVREFTSWQYLIERIAKYIDKINGMAILIIDETEISHDITIRDSIKNEIKNGYYTKSIKSSRSILNRPLFMDSKDYVGIQLSDLVAYSVFKKYSNPITGVFDFNTFFNMIYNKFDTSPYDKSKVDG